MLASKHTRLRKGADTRLHLPETALPRTVVGEYEVIFEHQADPWLYHAVRVQLARHDE